MPCAPRPTATGSEHPARPAFALALAPTLALARPGMPRYHRRMRILRCSGLVLLVVTLVLGPALPAAQAAPPAFRYTLVDGTVLVGVPLGDEQGLLTIQTSLGVVRVPKGSIRSIELADAPPTGGMVQQPAPMPMPTPMPAAEPTVMPTVVIENRPPRRRKSTPLIASGAGTFAGFWFASALAASISIMGDASDNDALYGFVPVAGPIVWAAKTDSREGLGFAILGGIFQAGGLLGLSSGLILRATENAPSPQRVLISPNVVGGMDRGGISVSVPF